MKTTHPKATLTTHVSANYEAQYGEDSAFFATRHEAEEWLRSKHVEWLKSRSPLADDQCLKPFNVLWREDWGRIAQHYGNDRYELLEACKTLYGLIQDGVLVRDTSKDNDANWSVKAIELVQKLACAEGAINRAEAQRVIAKAENPNAETVQSYPAGRWTKKGTV